MQGPVGRRLTTHITSSITTSFRPPLCSKCLRPIHVRNYATKFNSARRAKRTTEFSSRGRDQPQAGPSILPSTLSSTDVLLRDAFSAVFDSSKSTSPPFSFSSSDSRRTIEITYPLIFRRQLRALLDPYLEQISSTISSLQGQCTPDELRQAITILGHCWTRATYLKYPNSKIQELERNYADFILSRMSSTDPDGLPTLLQLFESSLERQSKTEYLVGKELIAVWAMLRGDIRRNDKPAFTVKTNVTAQDVREYLSMTTAKSGEDAKSAVHHVEGLLVELTSDGLSDFEGQLHLLRRKADYEGIINLWETFKTQYKLSPITDNPRKSSANDVRDEVISIFLKSFKRAKSPASSFATQFNDVLEHLPRPIPRSIAHTLLALRAGPAESKARVGEEVLSLDHEDTDRSAAGDPTDYLRSTWDQTEEKDLKMYMIYLDGLGRSGDLPSLKETWNALIKDEKAKAMYLKEENLSPSTSFPPTQALNQMISSCLLVPDGPSVALDLFSQAIAPSSSIPINLITINTVLRHHARQADLPSMSGLFTLAEKMSLKPDIVTYTTLVQGLLKGGRIDLAKKVLEDMVGQGIPPNERMCSMLISDLSKIGTQKALSHAEELLNLMIKRKMNINEVTWTGLISGYIKNGWEKNGYDTIARMEKSGLRLNRIGYNILLKQFSSIDSSPVIGGQSSQGIMKLWSRMLKDGITPNSDSYLLILNPLVTGGRWAEADQVINEMQKRVFRVEKGSLKRLVEKVKNRR
ncbi:uncharacterized protein I206_101953 [Kwoniella pini CBS 10737]|uniref:Pentatricopeptide repeat domain-containing protein n=1 Tax=Kwoniella pini CBS 10737 TaxID=1296096 RepID=A0A1B9HV92_9TREE|nr:uncharacterized protein I206_06956 [Kwoniella pini CBS 10737]OCF47178.1 hypothetical protein I206_06956 [Kwoniella pini CBS 10737]